MEELLLPSPVLPSAGEAPDEGMSPIEAWEWEAAIADPDRRIDRVIFDRLSTPGGTLVEFDCGTGIHALRAASHCGLVVAVEHDREFLKAAKKRYRRDPKPNLRIVSAKRFRTHLPAKSASVAVIRVRGDLMSLPGRFAWLEEARRVARDSMIVIEPSTEKGSIADLWGLGSYEAKLRDDLYESWGFHKEIVETTWHAPGRFVLRRLLMTLPASDAESVAALTTSTTIDCAYNVYSKPLASA